MNIFLLYLWLKKTLFLQFIFTCIIILRYLCYCSIEKDKHLFKSVFTVGFYTLISRILGFIRDIFIASYLGSTIIADAFFVAFRIPNYFRRVFAEGAFSAAFIPVFSGLTSRPKNNKEAIVFVEHTMSLLFFAIIVIYILRSTLK